jgi:hypothetical protein
MMIAAGAGGQHLHIHVAPVQAVMAEGGLDHRDGWVARRTFQPAFT